MNKMIPSELIHADKNGNAVIDKNLEVNGKVFTLNGKHWGIMPVYTTIDNNTSEKGFIIYSDRPGPYNPAPGVNQFYIKGIYADNYGDTSVLSVSTNKTDWYSVENDILYIKNQEAYNNFQKGTINLGIEKQNKLYRHVITLHANSTSDGSCRLEWISPNDLVCDSLQDLRTVLGNPPMQSYVASNPGGDLFGVVISPSTAQFKKVGTTSLLNITSVSDTVTPL